MMSILHRLVAPLLAFALALSLAACGSKTTPTPATGSVPTKAAAGESEAVATPTMAGEATPAESEEEELDLENISGALSNLSSYRSSLHMTFSGTNADGEAVVKSWSMEEQLTTNPSAQQVLWYGSEAVGDAEATVTRWSSITLGDTYYILSVDADGTESCIMVTSEDTEAPSTALSPDMWGSISDARYRGTESVNGVRTKHYEWKEGSLTGWGFADARAETWVSVDGGYVVRQIVEGTGTGLFLADEDETGTTRWEWNVTDANAAFEIVAPEGCESAAGDMPVMPDATNKATMGDMITYSSPSALATVAAFYKTELAAAGWEPSGEPMEMDTVAQYSFVRDDSTASLILSWDEDNQVTTVVITIE